MKSVAQKFSGALLKAALPAVAVCGFLTTMSGCARPYGVPAFTQLVAEAPAGKTASFQAPDDGSVWVGGPGRPGQPRYIVYSGLIRRGEVLTVDQSSGRLMLNGRPLEASIDSGNKAFYQVWYKEAFYDWY